MPTKARAAIFVEKGKPLVVDEIEIPDPGPGQVLVKLFASGICHSQLHQIHQPRGPLPMVMGHEATAEVQKVGPGVTYVKPGDWVMVAVIPHMQEGDPAPQPTTVTWKGKQIQAGSVYTWATHMLCDHRYLVQLEKGAVTDVTAVIGCAVITGSGAVVNTANVQEGNSVAVFGVGGVGLSAISAAAAVGAYPIIAVDLDEAKLEFARRFGATHGVNARAGNPVEKVKELTHGGADFVFDAIGVKVTQEQITLATRPGVMGLREGGTAVLIGVPQEDATINTRDMLMGGKKFIASTAGSGRPRRDLPRFYNWYKSGKLQLNGIVSKRYTLDQINEGVTDLDKGRIFGRRIIVYS
jgi:Zn-dependent alcohol dehydrogenase